MSKASREREALRREQAFKEREAHREWQRKMLAAYCGPFQPLTWEPGKLNRPLMKATPWTEAERLSESTGSHEIPLLTHDLG